MAEEFVGKDQFNEFVKRMEQGFHHADQRHNDLLRELDQRFSQIDQRFSQTNQRADQLERRMDQGFNDLRQDIRTLNTTVQRQMWALIAVVVGAAIKVLFFP